MSKLNEPMTDLTRSLLHSIPKKVYLWLEGLGVDLEEPDCQHRLGPLCVRWDFSGNRGVVSLYRHGMLRFTIFWDKDLINPAGTYSGWPLDKPLEDDLASFVEIEQDIYKVLQDLDDKIRGERNKQQ